MPEREIDIEFEEERETVCDSVFSKMDHRQELVFDLLLSGNYLKIPDEHKLAQTCTILNQKIEHKSRVRFHKLVTSLQDTDEKRFVLSVGECGA